jgi:hypothetical protein
MFPKNLIRWLDLNPGILVPEADAMSTSPRRLGLWAIVHFVHFYKSTEVVHFFSTVNPMY